MRKMTTSLHVFILTCLLLLSCFSHLGISLALDTLRAGEVMRDDGGDFLKSSGDQFRLLFFTLHFSSNRYLGIQHMCYSDETVIWIANPENPLMSNTGVLKMSKDGNLVIFDTKARTNFTINSKQPVKSGNASLTLLNSGNLVLRVGKQILWQSFDYLSRTFLPGMKLGIFDLKNGQQQRRQFLTSWLSPQVPVPGAFTLGLDPDIKPQLVIWRREVVYWRSGAWNGYNFSHLPDLEFYFSYFKNEKESYFNFTVSDDKLCPWIGMDSFGQINVVVVDGDRKSKWTPLVSCEEDHMQRTKGCVEPEPSGCRVSDMFSQANGVMDAGWEYLENLTLGVSDCREICVKNCSCNAYFSMHSDGRGCKFSHGQKLDRPDWEQDTFCIRGQKYNTTDVEKDHPRKRQLWLTVGVPMASLIIFTLISILCYLLWGRRRFGGENGGTQEGISHDTEVLLRTAGRSLAAIDELSGEHGLELSGKKGHELPLFNFSSIEIATNHFSDENKLGQGGFGPVYKGRLVQGQEIAVKRLCRFSKQGIQEFKNEVIVLSKLQHRNLVRLLGCCIQGEERILIYEYLSNNSLDSFIFDAKKRADWKRRVCIIEGIAQGLLYLHKYSRLRIIHRDLKTSNILLDSDMNPKISDFGTARIFGENESQANTNRIVGTYGYMSPEYAMDGIFSEKSDVFSFGVMMLEIISGKKNNGFYQPNRPSNLLGHAWNLYREGRCLELMDPTVKETCTKINGVMQYLQVGLLCVQESAMDRPTMSDVVYMLSNESMTLPTPKQPAFSAIVSVNDVHLSDNPRPYSVNDVTISEIEAR